MHNTYTCIQAWVVGTGLPKDVRWMLKILLDSAIIVLHGVHRPCSFLTTVGRPTNSNSGGRPLSVRVRVVLKEKRRRERK